jgi:hypothetical protein
VQSSVQLKACSQECEDIFLKTLMLWQLKALMVFRVACGSLPEIAENQNKMRSRTVCKVFQRFNKSGVQRASRAPHSRPTFYSRAQSCPSGVSCLAPTVPDCRRPSPTVLDCPQLSPTVPNCPQLSPTVPNCPHCPQLSPTVPNCPRRSLLNICTPLSGNKFPTRARCVLNNLKQ